MVSIITSGHPDRFLLTQHSPDVLVEANPFDPTPHASTHLAIIHGRRSNALETHLI